MHEEDVDTYYQEESPKEKVDQTCPSILEEVSVIYDDVKIELTNLVLFKSFSWK